MSCITLKPDYYGTARDKNLPVACTFCFVQLLEAWISGTVKFSNKDRLPLYPGSVKHRSHRNRLQDLVGTTTRHTMRVTVGHRGRSRGRAVNGVGLKPLDWWDRGFESS
jgi:hypothetical protein